MKLGWGAGAPRHRTAEANWQKPIQWNKTAMKEGKRRRVFSLSLGDWADAEVPDSWRDDLFALIRKTPCLDWLLLTKRASRIHECLPADWGLGYPNVWLGVSAEDQKHADARIPYLLRIPAVVHFVSAEPLLGPIDMQQFMGRGRWFGAELVRIDGGMLKQSAAIVPARVSWAIIGGESGANARPMFTEWARDLLRQCRKTGTAYFFKQHGDASPDRMPGVHHGGDLLDGAEYHEFPAPHWDAAAHGYATLDDWATARQAELDAVGKAERKKARGESITLMAMDEKPSEYTEDDHREILMRQNKTRKAAGE